MPTYDYECGACKKTFEIFHSMSEKRKKCPKCGAQRLTRLFGPGSGFLFKGSGFYITDYRSADYASKAKADAEKSSPSPSGSEKGGAEKSSSKETSKEASKGTPKDSSKGKKAGVAKD